MALGLADLVRNGTMSAEIGATLTAAVEARRSFLVFAVPRLAGKSTVMEAMLARASRETPIRWMTGHPTEIARLRSGDGRGYVVIPEISQYPVMPGYIWGAPVRRVFSLLDQGHALAAALHAPGVHEAFDAVCRGCGVPDEQASRIALAVYVRSLGDWQAPTARRVAEVHQILRVAAGVPEVRLLHRWDEATDRFVTPPKVPS